MIREITLFLWRLGVCTVLIVLESVIGIPMLSLGWLLWSTKVLSPAGFIALIISACLLYSSLFNLSLTLAAAIIVGLVLLFSEAPHQQQVRNRVAGVLVGSLLISAAGGLVFTPVVLIYVGMVVMIVTPFLRRHTAKPLGLTVDTQWWKQVES